MEERTKSLRAMKICRFCLNDSGPLRSIYERDKKLPNNVPLPLQIMACVAIEIFPNDGMPQLICDKCRKQTVEAYKFKTTCKKSDDALKLYLATGSWIKPEPVDDKYEESDLNITTVTIQQPLVLKQEPQKKRPNNEQLQANPSPKKSRSTVVIENNMLEEHEIILHHIDENTFSLDESGQEVENAVQNIRFETADVDESEGKVEYLDYEDEDVTHPTLKVAQVKTAVFPCTRCERSFPLQQLLEIHMQNHNRERKFGCDECGRKFFSKYDLGKHYLVHTGDKPYVCVVCGKPFSRESLLHRHEKIHVEVPKYLCTQCDRTFLTREDLDNHSEKHKKRRPFQCKMCNKSFVFKQGLERHEVTHTDAAAHKCNYCEASFSTPGKLARHITSHAGIRPYPCKVCGRTFLLSHHLTRHMRTSHGTNVTPLKQEVNQNGQFKCDVCSMSFRRKDSLINHTAIHSMVNLKCIICNTAFPNAQLVKEHITTHLTGLPYPCDKCEYSFESQQQLEDHEVKHVDYAQENEGIDEEEDDSQYGEEEDYEPDEYIVPDDTPMSEEIIRKSTRGRSVKNYAQFLKDGLGSDSESNVGDGEDYKDPDVVLPTNQTKATSDSIKPVVRAEGTKVYQKKDKKSEMKLPPPKILNSQVSKMAKDDEISQPISIEHFGISEQTVNEMPNKRFIDMKIGEKMVRVKKLMMTKAEIEEMAKQGKIAMKGNTILLKNDQLQALQHKSVTQAIMSPGKSTAVASPKSSPATAGTTQTTTVVKAPAEAKTVTKQVAKSAAKVSNAEKKVTENVAEKQIVQSEENEGSIESSQKETASTKKVSGAKGGKATRAARVKIEGANIEVVPQQQEETSSS